METIKANMYEMEYRGGAVKSDLSLVPFDEKYYKQYKNVINDCFYEMRKALNIKPYDKHSNSLVELAMLKESTFLLLDGDVIICAVSFFGNELGNVVVNPQYQRQGYGRKLMEFALQHMQKRGDSPIKLMVNTSNRSAIALYSLLGFEVMKEIAIEGANMKDADGNWKFEVISIGDVVLCE